VRFLGGGNLPDRAAEQWRDRNELGHPAPISFILGRSAMLAVGATDFVCYRNGFEFRLVVVLRDLNAQLSPLQSLSAETLADLTSHERSNDPKAFRLTVKFADDSGPSTSDGTQDRFVAGAQARTITLLQGRFDGIRCEMTWFVSPLPRQGSLLFECFWGEANAAFNYQLNSTDAILSASRESRRLLIPTE